MASWWSKVQWKHLWHGYAESNGGSWGSWRGKVEEEVSPFEKLRPALWFFAGFVLRKWRIPCQVFQYQSSLWSDLYKNSTTTNMNLSSEFWMKPETEESAPTLSSPVLTTASAPPVVEESPGGGGSCLRFAPPNRGSNNDRLKWLSSPWICLII